MLLKGNIVYSTMCNSVKHMYLSPEFMVEYLNFDTHIVWQRRTFI